MSYAFINFFCLLFARKEKKIQLRNVEGGDVANIHEIKRRIPKEKKFGKCYGGDS